MSRKRILILALAILIILSLLGCKTQTNLDVQLPPEKIHFGNGGGFAGIVKEYILHSNGSVQFKVSRDTVFHHIATVDQQVTAQMFDNFATLKIGDLDMNSPGNMYCYLYGSDSDKSSKLVWNQENPENKKVDLYLNTLLSIVHKYKIDK